MSYQDDKELNDIIAEAMKKRNDLQGLHSDSNHKASTVELLSSAQSGLHISGNSDRQQNADAPLTFSGASSSYSRQSAPRQASSSGPQRQTKSAGAARQTPSSGIPQRRTAPTGRQQPHSGERTGSSQNVKKAPQPQNRPDTSKRPPRSASYADMSRSNEGRTQRAAHNAKKPSHSPKSGNNNNKGSKKGGAKEEIKRWSLKKKIIAVLLILLIILVILGTIAFVFIMTKLDMVNTVDRGYDNSIYNSIESDSDLDPTLPNSPSSDIDALNSQIDNIINNSTPIKFSDDVYNILLIGTDARNTTERGRSDSMILVSLNKKTKTIVLTSIMRDIWISIPGKSNGRINSAYAWGGADLLIQTIESHFKVRIDKFVRVNFFSFEEVIDSVGGVEITVSDAEAKGMEGALRELNKLEGVDPTTDFLGHGGTYILNGKQALAYARLRYVGNADFERTERQRRVLEQILKRAKGLSMLELNDCLDTLLPLLTTDLTKGEMLGLIVDAPTYLGYDIVQQRIPADGMFTDMTIGGAQVLGIDFEKTTEYMIETIYSE